MNKGLLALFLICLSISSLTVFELVEVLALPADTRNNVVTPGGAATPCTYDNYQDNGKFIAKNCKTGDNDFKESTASALWNDENTSGVARFWEAGTWDFVLGGGSGAVINNLAGVTDWGLYGQTIFKCSTGACVALTVGNQGATDVIYHAFNYTLHDVTLDGANLSNSACLSIATSLNVYINHVIVQNCNELATGGFRLTNWNTNQIQSRNVYIENSQFVKIKITLSGTINGYLRNSNFVGQASGVTTQALVDFSKGDIIPTATNNLGNFCFCGNTISGWTKGAFAGFQAISNDTIAENTIRDANSFIQTVDTASGLYFEGLTVRNNYYSSATGGVTFCYGHSIYFVGNTMSFDTSPGTGSTAITFDKAGCPSVNQTPKNVILMNGEIYKWGGIGISANFLDGVISGYHIYDVNQAGGSVTGNVGILLGANSANTLITANTIISDTASGAGTSVPINYNGAGNDTVTGNYFAYKAGGNLLGNAIFYSSASAIGFQAYGNAGYNPVPKLTNFIVAGGIGQCGTGTTPVSGTVYVVCGYPIIWTCTGGTVTGIAEQDNNGNQIFSVANCAALPAIGVYSPIADKIVFTFSVAPTTISVFGA